MYHNQPGRKQRQQAFNRKWDKENPGKRTEASRKWREVHADQVRTVRKKRYVYNKERQRIKNKEAYDADPEYHKERRAQLYIRKLL
jgi:hypothetical protein